MKGLHWSDHVEAWKESGKSRRKYTEEQRINIHTFNTWVTRYRDRLETKVTEFVAVKPEGLEEPAPSTPLEISTGGYTIRIRRKEDLPLLEAVLSMMGGK